MYLEVRGQSIEAIADALADIKDRIENTEQWGNMELYGEIVAWKLNVNQR